MADPHKYYINNVNGTLSLLGAMREAGCHRPVFSSTGAVYGNADSRALSEDHPCAPINTYGATKWMIERILADYRGAYGFGAFCLRYFNASGADPSGAIGELRDNETHLIPRAMMAMQGYLSDFAVFGTDYDTPDGTAIRDYIHVTDLAAAHVAALKLLMHGHQGGAFNLGTGKGFSVREILEAIARETGSNVPHLIKPRRAGDPAYLVADASAARKVLQFSPGHSDLATIIRTAWAWHLKAHPLQAA
jgi:UDP-glucose 4-epimerase